MKAESSKRDEELVRLIKQAQAQPGIPEVMAIYNNWRKLEDAARPQLQAMNPKIIVTSSDTSHYNNI